MFTLTAAGASVVSFGYAALVTACFCRISRSGQRPSALRDSGSEVQASRLSPKPNRPGHLSALAQRWDDSLRSAHIAVLASRTIDTRVTDIAGTSAQTCKL